ncbi:ArsR family transcriptional regulator [Planococcus glaciei]|uniref:ArsR/SmtB family transcription factor n=1 Tax=Planococcus glaciei TaxID=459472 RepID=UPI00087E25D8|nr:metalloregulator ArsR/SmtB family transcription factor [Planococcus glaciei]SDI45877.1 ArsR family transcriptional regulator [Planococcus glaciei]
MASSTEPISTSPDLDLYAQKFKALADPKRLELLNLICRRGSVCVCDLVDEMAIPQSKLSYHLKILLNAELLHKENRGTWSYYSLNSKEMDRLLSNEICRVLSPSC